MITMKKKALTATLLVCAATISMAAFSAQTIEEGLAQYREMLQDGNPADLYADAGMEKWNKKNGSSNKSLSAICDLGLGVGRIRGASAQLPRYFKDTDRVQDLESRLLTCMEKQGIDIKPIIKGPDRKRKDMIAIVTYIVGESKGMKINISTKHPKMKALYDAGKYAFNYRSGPYDFSCATCHSEKGKRIRVQALPDITKHKGAAAGWGNWPAYRIGNGQMWTMQKRLNDCYRQQRIASPGYASDVTIALSVYMAKTGNGGIINTPAIKR